MAFPNVDLIDLQNLRDHLNRQRWVREPYRPEKICTVFPYLMSVSLIFNLYFIVYWSLYKYPHDRSSIVGRGKDALKNGCSKVRTLLTKRISPQTLMTNSRSDFQSPDSSGSQVNLKNEIFPNVIILTAYATLNILLAMVQAIKSYQDCKWSSRRSRLVNEMKISINACSILDHVKNVTLQAKIENEIKVERYEILIRALLTVYSTDSYPMAYFVANIYVPMAQALLNSSFLCAFMMTVARYTHYFRADKYPIWFGTGQTCLYLGAILFGSIVFYIPSTFYYTISNFLTLKKSVTGDESSNWGYAYQIIHIKNKMIRLWLIFEILRESLTKALPFFAMIAILSCIHRQRQQTKTRIQSLISSSINLNRTTVIQEVSQGQRRGSLKSDIYITIVIIFLVQFLLFVTPTRIYSGYLKAYRLRGSSLNIFEWYISFLYSLNNFGYSLAATGGFIFWVSTHTILNLCKD